MSTRKPMGFDEVLKAASKEVATWPDWMRSDEMKAWGRSIEEQRRQLRLEKAQKAAQEKDSEPK